MPRLSLLVLLATVLLTFSAAAQESADLSVIAFPGDVTVGADKPFELEFIVTNNGPAAAHDVRLTVALPTNLPQVFLLGLDGFSCTRDGVCTAATLAPSATLRAHVGGRSGFDQVLLTIPADRRLRVIVRRVRSCRRPSASAPAGCPVRTPRS